MAAAVSDVDDEKLTAMCSAVAALLAPQAGETEPGAAMSASADEADVEFERLLQARAATSKRSEPVLKLGKPRRRQRADAAASATSASDAAAREIILAAAHTMNLETRAQLIPGLADIAALARVLLDVASTGASRLSATKASRNPSVPGSLNYEGFCTVRKTLHELAPTVAVMLTPDLMMSMQRDMGGNILKQALLQRIGLQSIMERARADIAAYSSSSDGRLLESDLETFFRDVQSEVPGVRDLTESFFPFYMHAAVRALLFTLDRAGSGSVGLSALAGSVLFAQFAVLWQGETAVNGTSDSGSGEAEELQIARWVLGRGLEQCVPGSAGATNWFSVDNCVRLYRQYLGLDEDKDGMLGPSELCRFNEGAISARFVDRVIAEKFTFAGQMDFRGFLDLSLALERTKEPQAVRCLFSILANSRTGRLDRETVAYYLAEVGGRLGEVTGEAVATTNFVTEWLDMVGPEDVDSVTVRDLLRCPLGHTALRMLTDVHALWAFDNRENLGTHKHEDEEDDEDIVV